MKQIKLLGNIAVVAIIVFSLTGCSGDWDAGDTGTVKAINNSSSRQMVGVYDEDLYDKDRSSRGTSYSSGIGPGENYFFQGVKADKKLCCDNEWITRV